MCYNIYWRADEFTDMRSILLWGILFSIHPLTPQLGPLGLLLWTCNHYSAIIRAAISQGLTYASSGREEEEEIVQKRNIFLKSSH